MIEPPVREGGARRSQGRDDPSLRPRLDLARVGCRCGTLTLTELGGARPASNGLLLGQMVTTSDGTKDPLKAFVTGILKETLFFSIV